MAEFALGYTIQLEDSDYELTLSIGTTVDPTPGMLVTIDHICQRMRELAASIIEQSDTDERADRG